MINILNRSLFGNWNYKRRIFWRRWVQKYLIHNHICQRVVKFKLHASTVNWTTTGADILVYEGNFFLHSCTWHCRSLLTRYHWFQIALFNSNLISFRYNMFMYYLLEEEKKIRDWCIYLKQSDHPYRIFSNIWQKCKVVFCWWIITKQNNASFHSFIKEKYTQSRIIQ